MRKLVGSILKRLSSGRRLTGFANSGTSRPVAHQNRSLGEVSYPSRCSLLQQRRLVVLQFFRRNDHCGGYLVFRLQVQQADALRGAAGGADSLGVNADHLAPLTDDHQPTGLVDEKDRCSLADLWSGLDVRDALSAARGEAILVNVGALAEAVFGDG